jgi:tRNA1Val (adenine37-N6)-methyltransferase
MESPSTLNCWKCSGSGKKVTHLENKTCTVCGGSGSLSRKRRRDPAAPLRPIKEFLLFFSPGPQPALGDDLALKDIAQAAALEGKELSFLCGKHRIFQSSQTHKYSTDDVVTAWVAWRARLALNSACSPTSSIEKKKIPLATCDIGCGIGSVLLMTRWLHPEARLSVGIEAQQTRSTLAKESALLNWGVNGNVVVVEGDLREPTSHSAAAAAVSSQAAITDTVSSLTAESAGAAAISHQSQNTNVFDLVTGTPPYFDVAKGGAITSDAEAARCLFEFRGGIEEYCLAASKLLSRPPSLSLFVVCETSLALQRGYTGAAAAGLSVLARVDCVPKTGKPPLFCVYVMCLSEAEPLVKNDPALVEALKSAFNEDKCSSNGGALYPYADMRTDLYKTGVDAALDRCLRESLKDASTTKDHNTSTIASAPASIEKDASTSKMPKQKQVAHGKHLDLLGRTVGSEILVHVVTVRDNEGARTPSYVKLLCDLGKPS